MVFVGQQAKVHADKGVTLRRGMDAKYFIEYSHAYNAMATAISTAKTRDHLIALTGWTLDLDTFVTVDGGRKQLFDLFQAADRRDVRLYFLLNAGQATAPNNIESERKLRTLKNAQVVRDSRYIFAGTHHQKTLIVVGEEGITGFLGGMDFDNGRQGIDSSKPPSIKAGGILRDEQNVVPWHDVHCQSWGKVAKTYCVVSLTDGMIIQRQGKSG